MSPASAATAEMLAGNTRWRDLLTRFSRINRRMHNKQLIADGQAAVLGGRNIGDEYFGLGELDFQDLDILGMGAIAAECTASFEAYWESEFAVPVDSFGHHDVSPATRESTRAALREQVESLRDSAYARALRGSPLAAAFQARAVELHWAEGKVLADPPGKVAEVPDARGKGYLGSQLTPYIEAAQSELLVASAYFVPGKRGVKFFGEMTRRGVRVRILTNSLAATDVWLVHSGYRKYRRALLARGVKLYELKPLAQPNPALKGKLGSSRASLHAKSIVLDRGAVFVGSVNLDPRSLAQNTEVGVLVQCPELAREAAERFERWSSPALSYAVALVPEPQGSRLRWTGLDGGRIAEFFGEPGASLWRRLGAMIFSRLPIESHH